VSRIDDSPRAAVEDPWDAPTRRSPPGGSRSSLVWWLLGSLAFGFLLVALKLAGVVVSRLTVDTAQYLDAGIEIGLLSTAGIAMWAGAAAACALAALVLGGRPPGRYLGWTAALLLLLMVDDLLMLHDRVVPDMLGIPEQVAYAVYAAVFAGWLIRFRAEILAGEVTLLAAGGAALGLSVVSDALGLNYVVFEDYFKLIGIAAVLAYSFREARSHLLPATTPV
jgi:hypothetical protein